MGKLPDDDDDVVEVYDDDILRVEGKRIVWGKEQDTPPSLPPVTTHKKITFSLSPSRVRNMLFGADDEKDGLFGEHDSLATNSVFRE